MDEIVQLAFGANSLFDMEKLRARVRTRIFDDFSKYADMPIRQRFFVGAANIDDGLFSIADLKTLAGTKAALPLASSRELNWPRCSRLLPARARIQARP